MEESAVDSGSAAVGTRASAWELVAALFGSLLIIPAALLVAALAASDVWSETVAKAVVFGFPLVAWGVVVVVLVHYWRDGWGRLWSLPLVVFVGFFFALALLLLISSSIRRSVLPYKLPPPRTEAPRFRADLSERIEAPPD